MKLDALIQFYNEFDPASVVRFPEFYSADAWFKDPFNEVRGITAIQNIFTHMFTQVAEPRFVVIEKIVDANGAMLVWEFFFRMKLWREGETQVIRGISHLKFDLEGKVLYHRDYWDAAEQLYERLPLIGSVFRFFHKVIRA
jgi:steroid delta-isomerase